MKTYRINEFMEVVGQTGLKPLLFTHLDALADPQQEIARLQELDCRRETRANIICYLGRDCKGEAARSSESHLLLNPALREAVTLLSPSSPQPMDRLGHDNPRLSWGVRRFLRRFRKPVPELTLTAGEQQQAERYLQELFLVRVQGTVNQA